MKKKQKVDLIIDTLLIIMGVLIIIGSNLKILNLEIILFISMVLYATINLIQFIVTKKSKDYEGLYESVLSYVIAVVGIVFNLFTNTLELALILFSWVTLMSLIKLKKCDYYHDRNNRMWIIKVVTLILFIITGIITCFNLYYSKNIQILIIGIFFYIHGILEIIDPLTIYLMENK